MQISMSAEDRNTDIEEVVYNSIKHGARLIDTASKYEKKVKAV